jgi:hypothetical protein
VREDAPQQAGISNAGRIQRALQSVSASDHQHGLVELVGPDQGNARPPIRSDLLVLDASPDAKKRRHDWPELQAAKNNLKAEILRTTPAVLAPARAPTATQLAKQEAFLRAVSEAGLDSLSPEERESAYADLKRRMMRD